MSNEQQNQAYKLWEQKKAVFEEELAITSNPSLKFELKQRIYECEQELIRIKNYSETENQTINNINKKLNDINSERETSKSINISPDDWFTNRKSRLSTLVHNLFDDK